MKKFSLFIFKVTKLSLPSYLKNHQNFKGLMNKEHSFAYCSGACCNHFSFIINYQEKNVRKGQENRLNIQTLGNRYSSEVNYKNLQLSNVY